MFLHKLHWVDFMKMAGAVSSHADFHKNERLQSDIHVRIEPLTSAFEFLRRAHGG